MSNKFQNLYKANKSLNTNDKKELVSLFSDDLTFDEVFAKESVSPSDLVIILENYGNFWVTIDADPSNRQQPHAVVVCDISKDSKEKCTIKYFDVGDGEIKETNFTDFILRVKNGSDDLKTAVIRLKKNISEGRVKEFAPYLFKLNGYTLCINYGSESLNFIGTKEIKKEEKIIKFLRENVSNITTIDGFVQNLKKEVVLNPVGDFQQTIEAFLIAIEEQEKLRQNFIQKLGNENFQSKINTQGNIQNLHDQYVQYLKSPNLLPILSIGDQYALEIALSTDEVKSIGLVESVATSPCLGINYNQTKGQINIILSSTKPTKSLTENINRYIADVDILVTNLSTSSKELSNDNLNRLFKEMGSLKSKIWSAPPPTTDDDLEWTKAQLNNLIDFVRSCFYEILWIALKYGNISNNNDSFLSTFINSIPSNVTHQFNGVVIQFKLDNPNKPLQSRTLNRLFKGLK